MPDKSLNNEIAILGATSHIAKNIIFHMSRRDDIGLNLFGRSMCKMKEFLIRNQIKKRNIKLNEFKRFSYGNYDVIINCIGLGDPNKIRQAGAEIFQITETYDNLVLDYIIKHPDGLYINFSSGAVYGKSFSRPVNENDAAQININRIEPEDYYALAKINSESKHRSMRDLRIIDLRIFSFYSRFIDLNTGYLLSEIIRCVIGKKEFVTNSNNITRDYIHPLDLLSLVENCIKEPGINQVFDVYSLSPAAKFEILDFFKKEYRLKVAVKEEAAVSAASAKDMYYSVNKRAETIGYKPSYTSLQAISGETGELLKQHGLNTGGIV
jgi:nucleoside-diphosphate-sugar epimerase